jgi:hypothetical protein
MAGMVGGNRALEFGVYAALGYDVMSATNSSPQTTELFASDRSGTLMKWVHIGAVQGLALGAFGSYLEKSPWPFIGCASALLILYAEYRHADASGRSGQGADGGGQATPSAMLAWNNPG